MKKYIITITELHTLQKDTIITDSIDYAVELYLKGWDNLKCSITKITDIVPLQSIIVGITKDSKKSFSILCYTPEN